MNKSKSENSKRLINYKLLYTLPLACVGLCLTSQTADSMFKNSSNFFKNLESSSTGTSNPNIRPLTSSILTAGGGSSLSSRSSKLPSQTSSSLGTSTKTSTSTTTSTTAASSSSTSVGTHYTSSMHIDLSASGHGHKTSPIKMKPPSSGSESRLYTLTLGDKLETTVELPSSSTSGTKPKVSPSTNTKPVSSNSVDAHTYTSSMHIKLPASEDKNKPPSSGSQARLLIVELGDQVQAVLQLPSSISQSTVSSPQETDTSKILTSNLGSYVKNSVRSHLLNAFNQKTSTGTDIKNSEILNTLRGKVSSISAQTFNTEASRQLSNKNISINSKVQKDIENSANNFGELITSLVTNNFKQGVEHFNKSIELGNFEPIDLVVTSLRVSRNSSGGLDILANKHLTNSLRTFMKLYE